MFALRRILPWSFFVLIMLLNAGRGQGTNGPCTTTISEIAITEALLDDTASRRTYTLCPDSVYKIGTLDFDRRVVNGQSMIPIRPNLHIKCGETGSRSNFCWVYAGDVLLDGTGYFGIRQDTVENVVIEGITFFDAGRYMVWMNKRGNVVFKDCEFRESSRALTPVFLDYFDGDAPDSELMVTFFKCAFDENVFGGRPSQQPALVVGNSRQNRLIVEHCNFTNNDLIENNSMSNVASYLVETGGPLTMIGNCFVNNQIGVSVAAIYGPDDDVLFADNYQDASQGQRACPFVSRFESMDQVENLLPVCAHDFDAVSCPSSDTAAPTLAPTRFPTIAPTSLPTKPPTMEPTTNQPTSAPGQMPTRGPDPTVGHLPLPSLAPSRKADDELMGSPSIAPAQAPTWSPVVWQVSGGNVAMPCALSALLFVLALWGML